MGFLKDTQMIVFNTASLTGSYQSIDAGGFDNPIRVWKMYNAGSVDITVSYDGTTDQDIYPSLGTQIVDVQANHDTLANVGRANEKIAVKQQIWVKGAAGTGNLYIVGYP